VKATITFTHAVLPQRRSRVAHELDLHALPYVELQTICMQTVLPSRKPPHARPPQMPGP
jgi:hypothetical protein